MQRSKYITGFKNMIRASHNCESLHVSTSRVRGMLDDWLAWQGEVETFDLIGHPNVKRCYAWEEGVNGALNPVIVLAVPPMDSPVAAVNSSLAAKA
jgi:hypothetical protein